MGGFLLSEEMKNGVRAQEGAVVEYPAPGGGGLPCPGFEGFEKRLEVEFGPAGKVTEEQSFGGFCTDGYTRPFGLRAIPRGELDAFLDDAACTIVSHLPNEFFDSYVLSESSLFVFPYRVIIKTCGTTKLLNAIPRLLESAAKLGFVARRCKYTRGTFMFPAAQPDMHSSFDKEVALLDSFFGSLTGSGGKGKAYVLGDVLKFPNWHIYVADKKVSVAEKVNVGLQKKPIFTVEMCMTKLDRKVSKQFFQSAGFSSAAACTMASGVGSILPKSQIDDFLFEPCGYSMNGIEEDMLSTVHITPEDGFSYASFEAMGYGGEGKAENLGELLKSVMATFKPAEFSLALHVNGAGAGQSAAGSWGAQLPVFKDYVCEGSARQDLPLNSAVVFHTYKAMRLSDVDVEVSPLPLVDSPLLIRELELELVKDEVSDISSDGIFDVEAAFWEEVADLSPSAAVALAELKPEVVGMGAGEVDKYIQGVVTKTSIEEPFYVLDLGMVLRLWEKWKEGLPRVVPFYAVKCNPHHALLSLLASLGAGFDCASKAEMEAVASLGVSAERVIFANPCKLPSHIVAARKEFGVALTTFDSEGELVKLKNLFPEAKAVLRLRADDRGARCPLGVKYGAEFEDCEDLLLAAKKLGVDVVGVAFHVGSGASVAESYADGIRMAKALFDRAVELGMPPMSLLDIGGGFTAEGEGLQFEDAASSITAALEKYFPVSDGVKVIAEPGRFFAEVPVTLASHVFGTRWKGKGLNKKAEYWINDGIYGSMNCLLYDHAKLSCRPLGKDGANAAHGEKLFPSTVFGPTCDGLDTVLRDVLLPKLECGDWLVFPRMGAYTQAAGSSFNGFNTADISTRLVFSSPGEILVS